MAATPASHFNEATFIEELPDGGNNLAAYLKDMPCFGVGYQVQVALTIPCLDVAEAVPFLRQGLERFGEQREVFSIYRWLTGTGTEQTTANTNEVTGVQVIEEPPFFRVEFVNVLEEQLYLTGAVADIKESTPAHLSFCRDTSRDTDVFLLGLTGFQLLKQGQSLADGVAAVVPVGVGINAQLPNSFYFFLSLLANTFLSGWHLSRSVTSNWLYMCQYRLSLTYSKVVGVADISVWYRIHTGGRLEITFDHPPACQSLVRRAGLTPLPDQEGG